MNRRFYALLLLLLCAFSLGVQAQSAAPPPAVKPPAAAAAPPLTQEEIKTLDAVLEQATDVDKQLAAARLALESAENRANTIRAQFEIARLRACATRKLDPDQYEVVLLPVDLPNGAQAKKWTIRLRAPAESTAPSAAPSGGSAP